MEKPIINEVFADNGEHSHWELINAETGELLWSEDVEESNIRWTGKPLVPQSFLSNVKLLDMLKEHIINEYIPSDDTIEEVLKHIPRYFAFDKVSGKLYNSNSQSYEGIDGDTVVYTTYIKGEKKKLKGTVKGYTEHQIVITYEYGTDILTSENAQRKEIIKNKKWIK